MRKLLKAAIIIAIIALVISICSGCEDEHKKESVKVGYDGIEVSFPDNGNPWRIIEVSHDGNTHEFIYYSGNERGALSHWPDCKYCKEREEL